ncbi:hypothetical protein BBP00_00004374 [Phytophthora kernoviae]|uniref:Uncharacterized protein n=1 Tax=Phytophthora kernoviae TaxID=325452 RepID=A0A3F2RRZ6_9STRA|nr:hypothetical protein BBP00_00004374 [Phytophthora kernoviae]
MLLEAQVRALDQKVTTEIGELRGEAAESLAERTKLTEEAFKDQIEQIEKRFDYLLGVKMEVKELTRRADRHEKSLDDVRTAIEVLAKSLGTDDVDSESNDESEETLEEALEKPVESEPSMYSARRISLRSAPKSRSVALPIADAVPEEIEVETTKEDPVPHVDVLVLTRDSAKDTISSAETPHTDDIEVIEPTPQISELIQDVEEEASARDVDFPSEMETLIRLNQLSQLNELSQFPLILLSQLNLLLKSLSQKQRMNSSLRSAITALDEAIVELQPLADKVEKLERAHKTQARVIVDVEEKIQELGVEVQRLRTSSHRNNSMNSNVTTAVTSAISAQLQDVSSKFTHHLATFQTTEKIMVEVEDLRSSQGLIQNKVVEHGFAIEYSFAYAKEEDVKKSIEELMAANNEMRDLVTNSLEVTRSETLERDGLLGEEMNQLIARVSKKLDKDELLWTQEVLERQVQNVANASLDEHDLVDIHRRLHRKVDKNQLKSLLVDQSGGMGSSSGTRLANSTSGTEDDGQKTPLVGTKCISCQGELPPTKAMIKNAVREEVQQEIAKSRAHKSPSSLPTFNVSNHRSLEAFKKELLLSALQQQKPSSK